MSAAAAGPSALAHPSSTVDPQPAASSPHSTTTPQPGPHVHQQPSQLTHQSLLQHNNQSVDLEVDTAPPTDEDHDSAFDTESSASTSLASSIREYEYLNGRRYHSYRSGAYPLPNDEQEQDRLDLLHHIFLQCLGGKLYSAPLEHPTKVLDVGTGTGIWAIDFGDEHPAADVIGTDLSPIQPVWTAPNVRFYIDDCESEWVYGAHERFDYIHARGMGGAIKDWDRLIAQCYAHTQPGGWLEFQEPEAWVYADDDTLDRAPHIQQWQKLCNDAAVTFGKELRVGNTLKERMLNAGFVNVHERMIKVPIGPWPRDPAMKEIGRFQREHMASGIEPYTYGFLGKVLGWKEEECKVMIAKVVKEVRDRSLHMYLRFFFVYGMKPDNAVD